MRRINHGDPEQMGEVKRLQAMRTRQQREDLRAVLATPQGRRTFFWLVREVCNLQGGTMTGNSATFHNEGRRSVGVDVVHHLQKADAKSWALAEREAADEALRQISLVEASEARTLNEVDDNA